MNRISVIITVYNGERYLSDAIETVLQQTIQPYELIVIDDGSIDSSASIIKSFAEKAIYHYQNNRGLPAAQNTGINLAKGDYIAFLDADDLWVSNKLELQMQTLIKNSNLDAVFGYVQQFYSPDVRSKIENKIQCPENPMPGYIAQSMLIKRDSFMRVGMFSEKWTIGPFIEWFLRAQEKQLQHTMINDVVLKRRIHENNMGTRHKDQQTDYVRILKEALQRRKKLQTVANEK